MEVSDGENHEVFLSPEPDGREAQRWSLSPQAITSNYRDLGMRLDVSMNVRPPIDGPDQQWTIGKCESRSLLENTENYLGTGSLHTMHTNIFSI